MAALILACLAPLKARGQNGEAQERDAIYDNIDSYARKVLRQWSIPGFALEVVKDGDVVLAKGYGVRDRIDKIPVAK